MPAATGPGQFEYQVHPSPYVEQYVRLFNFDEGVDRLKPEHRRFLGTHLAPVLRRRRSGYVVVAGAAGRSGSRQERGEVARSRAIRIAAYLAGCGVPAGMLRLLPVRGGASVEAPGGEPWRRAAQIAYVQPPVQSADPFVLPLGAMSRRRIAAPNRFAIRIGVSIGSELPMMDAGFASATFQIRDFGANPKTVVYRFAAGAIGVGAPAASKWWGKWSEFKAQTDDLLQVDDFAGILELAGAENDPLTGSTNLILHGVPGGAPITIPNFDTGAGLRLGGSQTRGMIVPLTPVIEYPQ
ncbi:MAG: OmpA family protein [Bryobacterales bacterium]|nr:OmpA family protein [Bryobacterales bacterium]